MRRKDQEITADDEIEAILLQAAICRIGLCDGGVPYVVPLCFGYQDRTLYVHSASEGTKLDVIRKNNNVCFQVETDVEFVRHEVACRWGLKYRSVIGFGKALLVEEPQAKREALAIIMRHYAGQAYSFAEEDVERTTVLKVTVESWTGKQAGYA
jgi:nitroimidazol reductase NimA-like FMN-containing flavoprotein (pyridoxamine 5'-phosphate oxidase superfamily)